MSLKRFTATLGLLASLAAADAARPDAARALQAAFRAAPDSETLTLSAEGGSLPKYTVRRTGPQELTVTFDAASGEKIPAAPGLGGAKLVSGVRPAPGGFKILLKTSAFGYVNFPVSGKPQLQIQIFPDAVGASWGQGKKDADKAKPEAAKPEKTKAEQDKAKTDALAERQKREQAKAEKLEAAKRAKEAKAKEAEDARRAAEEAKKAAAEARHAPAPQPAAQAPAQAAAKPAPPADGTGGQPFFSVPYSMRMPVNKTVLGAGGSATLPALAGQTGQPGQPQTPPPAEKAAPAKPAQQAGGKLPPGVTEKPLLQEQGTGAPAARPAEHAPPPSVNISAPAPSAPPAPAATAAPARDLTPEKGQSGVRFRAEHKGPADQRPAEVLSGAPAVAKAPGQTMAQGQPALAQAQPGKPWEVRQTVQKVLAPSGATNATLPQTGGAPGAEAHAAAAADAHAQQADPHASATPAADPHAAGAPNASAPADAQAAPAKPGGKDSHGKDKEPQGPLSTDQLKDALLSAQSDMMGGKWDAAAKALEGLIREPNLKGDLREEALYALADTYMQAYKDSLAANYDKIAGAQQAAMNANQKSQRVPRALINLGLLNLKVNNLPEAKAYFNIIKKKYAQDQNASIVPFSLGEYYRAKGDLKAAADQYQNLIQTYPDSRMAKETAYILAQVLRKLGNFDKAFQIVDYLDKRWPLFYMESPAFLKLAAEVEEKVGKLQLAKDHYWTFYNLNPDNEFADITLVRIGDIYLRQNKPAAAREVYQKALRDFPEREGGLVARMRLAEEGIYDDPTMSEMAPVFGKPVSTKPNETYEYIMTKHPQSPLAPLAHIKLGMWQFHNKAYMEAMNTASSFLEKYPKSNLVGKANELGLQAFLQALPGLVQEGNYARVLQLYDNAPFVKDSHDKIGDEAQMAIAVSAWKRGQGDRALKLAGRFLGKQQVPKYSEMALDLAMNVFVERKEWKRISDLAARANAAWKLSPRQKAQFETARAMALENQGESEKALPTWTRLASDPGTDPATRAHATYVLAKDAARKQDMFRLFALSQEALGQLLATGGDKEKIKDCLLMAITATERSGRFNETLKWGKEFDRIIPDSDPDWAPMRLRLADVYRRGNQLDEWKTLLTDIVKKKPNTVYARMASQALESSALDQRLQNYLTKPIR
ncbi:MAG: tetratricopeptide repeat protein [Desulfovibrio sp.]|nr:tetratricopeptide repeat protein [Desulfovibrio sp.]